MLASLAQLLYRRRRATLAGAVVVIALAGAFGGPVAGLLDASDDFDPPAAEAVQARKQLAAATGASASPDVIALVRLGAPVDSPQARAKIARVAEAMRDRDVAQVLAVHEGGPRELVSRDGRSTYVAVSFEDGADAGDVVQRLEDRLAGEPGVALGGGAVVQEQVGTQVSEDLARAESLAFPILFVVSLFVFRGVVAALLPLAVGMSAILLAFSAMRLVNAVEPMSIFALNLIIGLGLGLAIDYSLFIVSRFREELERRGNTREALVATMRTAGRTVLFSAVTVAAALSSLIVFPQRFLFSMGIGGALVSLIAATVALTLLPAILAALGPRVNALSPRRWRTALQRDAAHVRAGFWYRLSRAVMRRPGAVAAGTAALLIVLGLPFLGIKFTGVDASVLPPSHSARVVDDALRAEFRVNRTSPVVVAARAPASAKPELDAYAQRLRAVDGVAAVAPP
ncbi:MAG TPA: MMPL family transporter, partial [Solirubrobacteraceae bacterium]|nr:MMPL family transporter [Solirubrobacteraceae bacterium]